MTQHLKKLGVVKWFNLRKGLGFINEFDKSTNSVKEIDYFVHYSSISGEGFKKLNAGELVEFKCVETEKGGQAQEVKKSSNNKGVGLRVYSFQLTDEFSPTI